MVFICSIRSPRCAATQCDRWTSGKLSIYTKNLDRLQKNRPRQAVSEKRYIEPILSEMFHILICLFYVSPTCTCSLLFPRLMACLTEMRTMTEEYSKQVLQIQDIQPDDISPLIMEVVSKSPCSDLWYRHLLNIDSSSTLGPPVLFNNGDQKLNICRIFSWI